MSQEISPLLAFSLSPPGSLTSASAFTHPPSCLKREGRWCLTVPSTLVVPGTGRVSCYWPSLAFFSFIWASGSPGSSCPTVFPPSLRWDSGYFMLVSLSAFSFPDQSVESDIFLAFLHGVPASPSGLFLGLPWLHCVCLSSPSVSPSISPEVWPPGHATVFPLGKHTAFVPGTTLPVSSTAPGSHWLTASPSGWRAHQNQFPHSGGACLCCGQGHSGRVASVP